jgi:RNA polymerase sigma-70 factor (ECF subfamily)
VDYRSISAIDLTLLCVKGADELAWREFIRRFHPLIARVAMRIARQWNETAPEVIDDLVQETYLKLYEERTRFLERFRPTHEDAVFGYIKVFTANLVHDHFKALRSKKRGGAAKTESLDDSETDRSHAPNTDREMDRQIVFGEIDACLRGPEPSETDRRDRRIFWLYYKVGLSAAAIAALPGIGLGTKGVESTLGRLTRKVRERLVRQRKVTTENREGIRPA